MNVLLTALVFSTLWVVTFLPAWYMAIVIALKIRVRPRNWLIISALLLLYVFVILLPYIVLLPKLSTLSELWQSIALGIIVLVATISIFRIVNANRITKALWGLYAYFYDSLIHFYPYKELIDMVAARALNNINPGSHVADIGAGTGNISAKLIKEGHVSQIIVVEPSKSMLKRAQHKLSKLSDGVKIEYENKSAVDFLNDIVDTSLDMVIMCNVLYAVTDRNRFWELLSDKLTSNGTAIITSSDRIGSRSLIKYHTAHASRWTLLNPGLLIVGMIDSWISQLSVGKIFIFSTRSELIKEAKVANLQIQDIQRCYGGSEAGVNLLFSVHKIAA